MQNRKQMVIKKQGKQANETAFVKKVARREAKKVIDSIVESKMYDGVAQGVSIDYSATGSVIDLLGTITQGTDDNQYVGRKIKPTYIQIRGLISHDQETNMVRMVVLQDKVSGVVLSGATIWQSVTNQRAPLSPFERSYDDTFNVLYDKTINFGTKDGLTDLTRWFKIKIKGNILKQVTFNDAAGTIESGGLYFCLISDSGASPHPYMDALWRIHYKDA